MVREPGIRRRPRHGRYYVEYVRTTSDEPQEQIQALLDKKDRRERHLIRVAGGLPEGA